MSVEGFAVPRMAKDLLAMLDHAGVGPVHWAGNSLGGILGLELLGTHEHRLRSLATFGTTYSLRLPRWIAHAMGPSYALFGPRRYALMAARGMSRNADAQALIASVVERFDPQVGQLIAQNVARYDLIANAYAARLPILLLRGGRDLQINVVLGATLRAMRKRPNFTLVDLPEGGHCANLDATERVRTELLKFWQRADGGAS